MTTDEGLHLAFEALVALLVVASGVSALIGAIGLLRMRTFYQRMHAASLLPTLASWCMALASIVYFSLLRETPVLHQVIVLVLLAVTVPVPTMLLTRAELFRKGRLGDAATLTTDSAAEHPAEISKQPR